MLLEGSECEIYLVLKLGWMNNTLAEVRVSGLFQFVVFSILLPRTMNLELKYQESSISHMG
jgi:hypothetical protein